MERASGIELGPASCVLVSARASADGAEVSAVHMVDPAAWPGSGSALAATLKSIRKAKSFPRHARVVLWGLEKSGPVSDPAIRTAVKSVVGAGFKVDAVLTPAEALAVVAEGRRRPNEGPIAWLSLNMHGAVIAIVHGSKVLFSKTLTWTYNSAAQSVKAQLLQRYSFVAHIGPELKHAIESVRAAHGLKVETVVTCGDLPDLRSLTMPLIEELDLEVETLDSADGLLPRGVAGQDRFGEWAPAMRLACAAAVVPVKLSRVRVATSVAAGILLAAAAIATYAFIASEPDVASDSPVAPTERLSNPRAAPTVEPKAAPRVEPRTDVPIEGAPISFPPAPPSQGRVERAQPTPTVKIATPEKKGGLLPAVPAVTSILIDNGRRIAMVGGSIVSAGDRIGPRVVVRIDADSVVLREPSGREITVRLRPSGR